MNSKEVSKGGGGENKNSLSSYVEYLSCNLSQKRLVKKKKKARQKTPHAEESSTELFKILSLHLLSQ